MIERRQPEGVYEYVVPARTLRGSTEEVLAGLDEAVEGLLALRQLITLTAARGEPPARPHRGPIAGTCRS